MVCNFIKKDILAEVFACEFCENLRTPFFIEHLWVTASIVLCDVFKMSIPYTSFIKFCLHEGTIFCNTWVHSLYKSINFESDVAKFFSKITPDQKNPNNLKSI